MEPKTLTSEDTAELLAKVRELDAYCAKLGARVSVHLGNGGSTVNFHGTDGGAWPDTTGATLTPHEGRGHAWYRATLCGLDVAIFVPPVGGLTVAA